MFTFSFNIITHKLKRVQHDNLFASVANKIYDVIFRV